jgi:hydrogenase maturation protein HypF
LHPRYFPTRFAEGLGLPLIRAQHHHAHIASVMAEHGLHGPVIGVSFDGTGYGTDGAIWGGEILICEGVSFERFSHLKYVRATGGDASVKDAWKSALSHLYALQHPEPECRLYNDNIPGACFEIDLEPFAAYCDEHDALPCSREERTFAEAAIHSGVNTIQTSSMGRLFDAVCAMLGIHGENRYEGECAIMLENAARRALEKQRFREVPTEIERLALAFHEDVAKAVRTQCVLARARQNISRVCLSGGVFQNRILMEETLRLLRVDGFTVYYNIHVPPNDGGIALGQNYIGMMSTRERFPK